MSLAWKILNDTWKDETSLGQIIKNKLILKEFFWKN
jgi:hypothetical protein